MEICFYERHIFQGVIDRGTKVFGYLFFIIMDPSLGFLFY